MTTRPRATRLLALLALAGCAGAPPPAPATAGGPRRDRPARTPPPPWVAVVLPAFESPYRVAEEPDGTQLVLTGTLRARVRGADVAWSRDATLLPLVAYARVADGWLFAARDGALFSAPSFAGPLTRVGEADGRATVIGYHSEGVLTARATDGTLWLGTARDGLRPAPAPADAPLVDAGFVDPLFGVAVVAPGRLLRTVDGGASFAPVDTGAHGTYVVYPEADGFVLATTGGPMRVGRDGPAAPYTGASAAFDYELPREARGALREAFLAEHPLAYPTLMGGRALLPNGRVAAREGDDLVVVSPRGPEARTRLPAADCDLAGWGAEVLARCDAEQGDGMRLLVWDRGDRWLPLREFPGRPAVLAARDGGAIVVGAACDADADDAASALCFYDGRGWRTRTLPPHATLLDVRGHALLYAVPHDDATEVDDVAAHVLALREPDGDARVELVGAGARLVHARFVGGDRIAGVAHRGAERFAAVGPVGGPLALQPLPAGAEAVAFADESRGIAAGRDLGQVFTTTDGGLSWSRLALPVDGDPSSVRLARPADGRGGIDPAEVACVETACFVGGRLLWAALPPATSPRSAPVPTLAARRAPPLEDLLARAWRPRREGFEAGVWRCGPPGGRAAAPGGPPPPERHYGGDGWFEPRLTAPIDPVSGRLAARWGGTDERGRYRAASRPGLLPPVAALRGPARTGEWLPRLLTRSLALLERCARDDAGRRCDVVALSPHAPPRVAVASDAFLSLESGTLVVMHDVLPLPDGGAALHLAPGYDTPTEARTDVVVRLDARGAVVARRGYAWPHGFARMLAVRGAEPGLAVVAPPAERALVFYGLDPGDGGRAFTTLPVARLGPCGAAAGAGALVASGFGVAPFILFDHQMLFPHNARAVLEVDGAGGVCLRGVSFWPSDPASASERDLLSALGGAPRLRAASGGLAGVALDEARDVPLVCAPTR